MNKKDKLLNEQSELESKLQSVQSEIKEIERLEKLSEYNFEIGEKITDGKEVYLYDGVKYHYGWKHMGKKIKKDGSPYSNATRLYIWGNAKLTRVGENTK